MVLLDVKLHIIGLTGCLLAFGNVVDARSLSVRPVATDSVVNDTGCVVKQGTDFFENVLDYMDSLTFDGVKPVYDRLNRQLMLTVSKSKMYDHNLQFRIKFSGNEKYRLCLGDSFLVSDTEVDFGTIIPGDVYVLKVRSDTGIIAQTNLILTFMPIVEVNGVNFERYSFNVGSFRISDADYSANSDSLYNALIRYRGGSTAGKEKKEYAVKLVNSNGESIDGSFHGLRTDNYWVLDAMSIDKARMRDPVSHELWQKYAHPFYYADREPQAQKSSRCFFVEVLLNGEYAGIYNVMERSDRKQFRLKKNEKIGNGEIVHGLMYESKAWSDVVRMKSLDSLSEYDNQNSYWDGWEIEYPELNEGQKIDWGPLYNAVSFVSLKSGSDFSEQVNQYFDMPVMVDYYLLLELMQGYDNMAKNMIYLVYDQQESQKLTVAPWDMDGTWGRNWDGYIYGMQDPTYNTDIVMGLSNGLYQKLMDNVPDWSETLGTRYRKLRQSYFQEDSIVNLFAKNFDLFKISGADVREENRWNGADSITLGFDNEREYLKNWILQRLSAMDEKYGYDYAGMEKLKTSDYFSISSEVGGIAIEANCGKEFTVYNVAGQVVKHLVVHPGRTTVPLTHGIYIIDRKKVWVR